MQINKTVPIILVLLIIPLLAGSVMAQMEIPQLKTFLLNQDPDPAKAGDVVEIRIRFQNIGAEEARNIWAEFIPEYPFTALTGDKKRQTIESLPNWPDEENSRTLTFKIRVDRDTTEGQYEISFRQSSDGGKTWRKEEFNIDITTKEFAEIIYIDKTKLMPGKETELTFTINNIGNAPLQNMIFSWSEPDGIILPVGTDNTRYIKYLEPGESIPLKYSVIASVNANPDLYALNLNLEYDIKNESGSTSKETVSTKAGIFVGGETDFDVTFSESSQGKTSLSVANVGSNPALSVTVRVPSQEGFRISGSTDAIVGNLDKGDYTIVSFQIAPSFQGFGNRNRRQDLSEEERQKLREQFAQRRGNDLNVVIAYTDTTGVRQVLEKTVPIQFRTAGGGQEDHAGPYTGQNRGFRRQQQSIWMTPTVILPIVVLLLIIGGIFYYRKRKTINSLFSKILKRKKKH